jgi:Skp family chaperone for outer membrane proteins
MKNPDLDHIRGMSEPFFFTANVLEEGRKTLLHCVIFASFEVCGASNTSIKIACEDVDPRMQAFIKFVWSNWLKEERSKLNAELKKVENECQERRKSLQELQQQIDNLKKKR